jgi:hypothetical protein
VGEDVVEFRLLYSGKLLGASKVNTRGAHKHDIRRKFHPQLRRLWQTSSAIHGMAELIGVNYILSHVDKYPAHAEPFMPAGDAAAAATLRRRQAAVTALGEQWSRNGYQFIPLVTEELCLRCSIEVLFLRPDEPRYVMQSGDLDTKVKTIFDALRMPQSLEEAGGIGPDADETPFYCLLQDDKLVSEISVVTDELLVLPEQRDVDKNDAFLIIKVRLKPTTKNRLNAHFE